MSLYLVEHPLEIPYEVLSKQCEVLFYGAMGTLYAAHHFTLTADGSKLLRLIAGSPLSKLY